MSSINLPSDYDMENKSGPVQTTRVDHGRYDDKSIVRVEYLGTAADQHDMRILGRQQQLRVSG